MAINKKHLSLLLILLSTLFSLSVNAGEEKAGAISSATEEKILKAINEGTDDEFATLLDEDPLVSDSKIQGRPILHVCINRDKLGKFAILLKDGANINATDSRGRTPLIFAAAQIRPLFVEALLRFPNVRTYVQDNTKKTALQYVANFSDTDAETIKKNFSRKETIHELVLYSKKIAKDIRDYQNDSIISEKLALKYVPESIRPIFQKEIIGLGLWRFVMAAIIVVCVILLNTISILYINHTSKKYDNLEEGGKRSLVGMTILSTKRAFRFFTWSMGLYLVISLLLPHLLDSASWIGEIVFSIAAALFLYDFIAVPEYYLTRWANKTENKVDDTLVQLFRKAMRIFIIVVIALHLYRSISGQPITTIIAGLGIGGMAIALAATDTLKNFIGFIMILTDKPFLVGERIKFDGHDGLVEQIGLRTTRLRRLDGHQVSIPNSKAVDSVVHNIGRREFIKRSVDITITYDTPIAKIEKGIQIVRDLLKDHEGMHPDRPARVYFTDMNSDNLNINATFWYHPAEWYDYCEFCEEFFIELMRAFETEGIEFAFPTQTLYLADDPKRRITVKHEK